MDEAKWLDEPHKVVDTYTKDGIEYVEVEFEDGTGASYTKEAYSNKTSTQ